MLYTVLINKFSNICTYYKCIYMLIYIRVLSLLVHTKCSLFLDQT